MNKRIKLERAVKVLAAEICTLDEERKTLLQVFLGAWVKFPTSEQTNDAVLSCFVPSVVQSAEILSFRPRSVPDASSLKRAHVCRKLEGGLSHD